jgi:DNA-binding transcriptional LysR family regulator
VFHTVARLLSFTKAADFLHMTQPAVTFQIRQLEEHFNTRLFDRTHNRISLTEAGETVFQYAERILGLYSEMDNKVRALTGEVIGVLMLGASTTVADYHLPALLGEFQSKFKDVKIRLRMSNTLGVVHMVEANEVDVGIVEGPVNNKNLVTRVCWQDRLMVICPPGHTLAGRKTVTVEDLLPFPFICREEGSGTREVISEYLGQQKHTLPELHPVMELGSPESVKSAVIAGMGVSILSESTIRNELKLGLLAAANLDPPLMRPFSIVHQRQKFRLRAMEEFLEFADQHCDKKSKL